MQLRGRDCTRLPSAPPDLARDGGIPAAGRGVRRPAALPADVGARFLTELHDLTCGDGKRYADRRARLRRDIADAVADADRGTGAVRCAAAGLTRVLAAEANLDPVIVDAAVAVSMTVITDRGWDTWCRLSVSSWQDQVPRQATPHQHSGDATQRAAATLPP